MYMFYTYVIKSLVKEYFYKGHCVNLEGRIKHNSGATKSIRPNIPFELVYFSSIRISYLLNSPFL